MQGKMEMTGLRRGLPISLPMAVTSHFHYSAVRLSDATVRDSSVGGCFFALIPVLVTGIQQRRVRGAKETFQPKDLGWLDSCDEHRNEDGGEALPYATDEAQSAAAVYCDQTRIGRCSTLNCCMFLSLIGYASGNMQ
ncbi:hypothetical protein AU381_09580 [Sinorhizobium glycinis]|uniref:Uncharacterized protein n=1 Tax=Sinorhizobium glycinis TaxID=1472378 RepID=A0A178XX40_9HYPH|nr:hypothetical protein AU381_09580 [Sinorhizobium glycinis]